MQDEQQFEQLMLQYRQLKNGSEDISRMIDNEDFDSAITMIKNREQLFLSCKCMRKYLELTPVEQKQADEILDEIRALELQNIKKLEKGDKILAIMPVFHGFGLALSVNSMLCLGREVILVPTFLIIDNGQIIFLS